MCNVAFVFYLFLFFFKQKTAYEMRISDWSSDVCSSDLTPQTLLSAVSVSDAVAIVPERLFELHKVNLKLKSMTPPFDIPDVKHQCVWHPRSDIDAGHEWLRRLLVAVAAE